MTREEDQRAIMARTHLECAKNARRALFPNVPLYEAMQMILITRVIVVAQYSGHKISKAGIARTIGMPRQTLNRRISEMIVIGLVKQDGRTLCIRDVVLDSPQAMAAQRKNACLFREAARKLYQNGQS